MSKKKIFDTKTLVTLGLLTALSIVLTRFLSIQATESIRISFGHLPIVISGILFGPLAGALTGFAADFIGTTLFSPFAWFAPLGITPVLMGFLPSALKLLFLRNKKLTMANLAAILAPAYILGPVAWSTLSLHWLYGRPLVAMLYTRIPVSAGIAVIEIFAICVLVKSGAFKTFGVSLSGGKADELRGNAQIHP